MSFCVKLNKDYFSYIISYDVFVLLPPAQESHVIYLVSAAVNWQF